MKRILKSFVLAAFASPVFAQTDRAGEFDYYVLALSWTPSWCALEGDDRDSPQCNADTGFGFTVHGLWPQYEQGWPEFCTTSAHDPSRRQTAGMADIMGTGGLAWYQWKKHGRCSGLSAEAYFDATRQAYESINRPEVLRQIDQTYRLPARIIEDAFMESNPEITADQITITCKQGRIQEARICLTKDLDLRQCGVDVVQDCSLSDAEFAPIR
ncbi:MAG: ribonuclease T2 [Rhodobacteraceae bacterium]|nr:ribonuclease T2 [Paracoccaceae bacterium]